VIILVGKKISQIRKQRGLSFRKLAQKTKLSPGYLCDIEKGRCAPSIKTLEILASALEVSPAFFLSEMVVDNEQSATLDKAS
jgi:transcriptional regulator with XRE-family HTH domain